MKTLARPVYARYLVRHRAPVDGHFDDAFLGTLDGLPDGVGDLVRLPEAEPYVAVPVSHHHDGAEAEPSAALHDLRYAVYVNHSVLQLDSAGSIRFFSIKPNPP